MNVIPRTKTEVTVQIPRKQQKIQITFSDKEILDAILEKYGDTAVGPENYKIPKNAEITIEAWDGVYITWYEDE